MFDIVTQTGWKTDVKFDFGSVSPKLAYGAFLCSFQFKTNCFCISRWPHVIYCSLIVRSCNPRNEGPENEGVQISKFSPHFGPYLVLGTPHTYSHYCCKAWYLYEIDTALGLEQKNPKQRSTCSQGFLFIQELPDEGIGSI